MTVDGQRALGTLLYLHGFASSPGSRKGVAFASYFEGRGLRVERMDLRLPAREELRPSAMVAAVKQRIAELGDAGERVAVVGSSLGGLVAAHAGAGVPPSVLVGTVLLAPAFGFAGRWLARLGRAAAERWQQGERVTVPDHAGGAPLELDFGICEDGHKLDAETPLLGCPTLCFHGRHDDVVPLARSRVFAALHRSELVELDDGHELVASLPVILPATEAFLRRCFA